MSPILNYQQAAPSRRKKQAIIALIAAIVIIGSALFHARVIWPRMEAAKVVRQQQAEFQRLLDHPLSKAPVAVVVLQKHLKTHPKAGREHGAARWTYLHFADQVNGPDNATDVQLESSTPWFGNYRHYAFQNGTNVFHHRRTTPDGRDFLVGLDVTVQGLYFLFHPTTLDLSTANASNFTVQLMMKPFRPIANYSFVEDTCYILPGVPDPNDASAFSFDVYHGDRKDTVTVRLQNDGNLSFTPAADARSENRWGTPKP